MVDVVVVPWASVMWVKDRVGEGAISSKGAMVMGGAMVNWGMGGASTPPAPTPPPTPTPTPGWRGCDDDDDEDMTEAVEGIDGFTAIDPAAAVAV